MEKEMGKLSFAIASEKGKKYLVYLQLTITLVEENSAR